jgi:hypothetical protein
MISTCLTGILPVEGLADFWPLQNLEWHLNNLLCPHTKLLELTFHCCSATKMFYQILHFPVSNSKVAGAGGRSTMVVAVIRWGAPLAVPLVVLPPPLLLSQLQ